MDKRILVIGLVVLLLVSGFFLYRSDLGGVAEPEVTETPGVGEGSDVGTGPELSLARDAVLGYEFSYVNGPEGYITLEDNESTDPDFFSGIMLMDWTEYEALQASTDAREGPPAMHVRIYENTEKLFAPVWAMRHPAETNYDLMIGSTSEAVVGGAKAEYYLTDGLYPTEVYVVAHGSHVYVLMGSYREPGDQYQKDFAALIESLTFIDDMGGAPQGKIDPTVACQQALTVMLFASGEAADQFLAECIAGEHPEVIEEYIKSLGLDGARI